MLSEIVADWISWHHQRQNMQSVRAGIRVRMIWYKKETEQLVENKCPQNRSNCGEIFIFFRENIKTIAGKYKYDSSKKRRKESRWINTIACHKHPAPQKKGINQNWQQKKLHYFLIFQRCFFQRGVFPAIFRHLSRATLTPTGATTRNGHYRMNGRLTSVCSVCYRPFLFRDSGH